ncbi:MAG: nucleotidyltransferase domain-containing protein [Synergistaceae bacterium]|jgi:predicted nucleotidyltransferase|uniref:type VII toxin-antitoxin system MntA family adenylyltransferase antitoxin n=1 Tax=Aminivibrio sp. TaxID=1872489 RepID=UPI001D1F9DB2|nr:nucleotidyltransferase domain-containing protein [Synergistaceae bacterium]MDD4022265.1 nucleotidyltransferase domain-containing protein [Synergistaceae bacterium]NCC57129.1 nucleotidyltransferase domain-containing protein [Synergistales bacterium]
MNEQIKRTLRLFFKKEDNIRLAFLIGSFATGKSRPDSDVDVAVLFGRIPDHMEILDLRERLSEGLKRDIDLVILNEAGPIIRMQALKTGIRLRAEKGAYEDFFVRTVNEYEDLKQIRAPIEEAVLRRKIYA